ncbi:MAG: glycoside hydrolase family 44 protein [Candidatus Acidiferrales bacterium]
MPTSNRAKGALFTLITALLAASLTTCGGYSSAGSSNGGGGGGTNAPSAPTGLAATPGNTQVCLQWNASTGASSYYIKRATTNGGPYAQISTPTTTSFTDTGLTNGTIYYYVVSAYNAYGQSANSSQVSATPTASVGIPPAPTGLVATAGNADVSLVWNASSGATSYHVKRSITSGSGYAQVAAPATANFSDTGLTNGTTYYYVVSAVNSAGESPNSAQANATPFVSTATVQITVNTLTDRHTISPYVYGVNFPSDTGYVQDSGATLIRWGGNASSRYNWKNFNTNAAADWYFSNRSMGSAPLYQDSTQFVSNLKSVGAFPIMTMPMLPWVAKDATSYSFSVAKYGAQCQVNPYMSDDGNSQKTDCQTNITGNNPADADVPLLDAPGNSDPAGSIYRNQWAAALSTSFGSTPHFYDMDNEIDIWGSTHRDVHPNPATYQELRDTFLTEARALKSWDAQAVRFGPVSCCWWFYWNSAAGNSDKTAHGSVDFLPWWLNEVVWSDEIAGTRSVDVFDIHAYPDTPDTSSFTLAEKQALALRILRDWWDPSYVSESSDINQPWATQIQPLKTIPFRIPRLRAIANTIYPGIPLSFTEWNVALAGETDFSTALADADAWGILARERVWASSRWTAADSTAPAYQALKLFRNYDGQHHGFGTISVSACHNANPDLFSSYAAISATGQSLTLLVINKDPVNAVVAGISLGAFTASQFTSYALSQASPNSIVSSSEKPWNSTQSFPAYSATLLVIQGTASAPAAEWDLNPDTVQAPANGTITLAPTILSGTGTVTLTSAQFDSGGGTISISQSQVTTTRNGAISVVAGANPGFFHFTVTAKDSAGVTQTEGGWLLVGNPAATLTKQGDGQSAPRGTPVTLSAVLNPGQSGGTAQGASILFTADSGTLSSRIVTTDSTGTASVTLTLPAAVGAVHVTAEGPYGLGHPVVTFTETSQ